MDELIDLIMHEGDFHPSEEVVRQLLALGEEVHFGPKKAVIEFGHINRNVYIVKEGILRGVYFEKEKEDTYGFASPGTILLSPHSYYMNQPAVMQFETCKKGCTCIMVPKAKFDRLLVESHEFARWMFSLASAQICICERKLSLINGSAMERYQAVLKNRPEIVEAVTDRVLASYLEITPQHLCRLKQQLRDKHS